MITIHPRSYYIGTTIERAALALPADAAGAHYLDTGDGDEYFWNGTAWVAHGGGPGAGSFLDLTDTPGSYVDQAGLVPVVNPGEDALEFGAPMPGIHDHRSDGEGGLLPNYLSIVNVARLRAGVVTEYADPDDAFAAADTAGDVILIPPGTWILSTFHSLAADVSVCGVGGPAETCILSANLSGATYVVNLESGAGVIQNVKIVATMTRSDNGTLTGLSLNTGTLARNVVCEITASGSTYTIFGVGIYTCGATAINCRAYLYISGSTIAGYAYYYYGGYLHYCYGYAEKTSGASTIVAGLYMGWPSTAYSFHSSFKAGGAIGSRYGILAAYGTNYLYLCHATGITTDLYIYPYTTVAVYGCKYNTLVNQGTISQMGGDRAGTDRADTISGLWTFDRGAGSAPLAIAQATAPTITNLDADKLDTYEASAFPRKAENATIAGAWTHSDDLYLAAFQDVVPDGETLGAGVFKRLANHLGMATYDDHFRSGVIPTGYTWDTGALFGGTPTSIIYNYGGSYLAVAHGSANKFFLRRAITNSAAAWQLKGLRGRMRVGSSGRLGFRYDNGSDVANDERFVELYVDGTAGNATLTLNFRYKEAAGAPVVVTSAILVPASTYLTTYLYCYYTGGNYSGYGYLIGEDAANINITGFSRAISWAPCAGRGGIILETSGAANYTFCDWFINTFG